MLTFPDLSKFVRNCTEFRIEHLWSLCSGICTLMEEYFYYEN
jgi:hypothetical protein